MYCKTVCKLHYICILISVGMEDLIKALCPHKSYAKDKGSLGFSEKMTRPATDVFGMVLDRIPFHLKFREAVQRRVGSGRRRRRQGDSGDGVGNDDDDGAVVGCAGVDDDGRGRI